MMKLGVILTSLLAISLSFAQDNKLLVVTQKVGLPEHGYQTSLQASYGTPTFGGTSGLSIDRNVSKDSSVPFAHIPPIRNAYPLPQNVILSQANSWLKVHARSIGNAMSGYMADKGASHGIYHYLQRVRVTGANKPKVISWQLSVDATGRIQYGDAKLLDEGERKYVHVTYTPLKVANGLPPNWKYTNAGRITWRLLDENMMPIGPMNTINVSGAYDAPEYVVGQPVPSGCEIRGGQVYCDPDFGLKCLIKKQGTGSCPFGHTDVVNLINRNGASGAIVDYVRTLEPVYDERPSASGGYESIARVSVDVSERKWEPLYAEDEFYLIRRYYGKACGKVYRHYTNVCSIESNIYSPPIWNGRRYYTIIIGYIFRCNNNRFNLHGRYRISQPYPLDGSCTEEKAQKRLIGADYLNSGTVGYQLKKQTDRYYVMPDGSYWQMNSSVSTDMYPTTNFSKKVSFVGNSNSCGNYLYQIIDPFTTNTIYDYRNDTVNGLPSERYRVAPITGC